MVEAVGDKDQEEQALSIHMDESVLSARFSDLVLINSSRESVVLSFVQRLPRNVGAEDAQPEAIAVGRVALTWPHFFRLVARLAELAKQRREEVMKHVEEQASQLEAL